MRLTPKKIEEILVQIIGSEGLPLIQNLIGQENVSEFDLATKIKYDIKVVRRLLYTLYNHNLVAFTRKKDKQKGWYIYYWTLLPNSIRYSYFKRKKELLERLKERLIEEQQELFFVCPNDCVRLNFDQSMDFEFHCPECGELINQDNGKERILMLEKKIKNLTKEVETLIEQRSAKRKLVKERARKAEEKAKLAARKKEVKKPVKKKVVKKKVAAKKKTATKKIPVKKKSDKKKATVKKKEVVKKKKVATRKKAASKKPVKKVSTKKKVVKKKVPAKKSSSKKVIKKTVKKKVAKKAKK
ncbi:hypothetical protein HN799_03475 [Candidatus Woesearchaeota archaeon]|jgi:transcription initiation factor TFIIE subunit alpha|nr:hypothetical protein [Candidatus Woesearchaeota archaeon]MBT4151146.1 hypothetical protein [Candidatus Woesearchaeota archaeon]MBT4247634.1 hypothetical protein [Candidatus Woesearchaeota archaeon]MBT7332308.1 hypothetical protein [Candidatus Woesearchaeota archaeon]